MQNERDHLIEEFITTTWDALFVNPQRELGVTDGGLCSLFTSGHPVLEETREAIDIKAPGFVVTGAQAFHTAFPALTERTGVAPETMRELAAEYLTRLGELVGADLADDRLVASYSRMLTDYVAYEAEHAETDASTRRPTA